MLSERDVKPGTQAGQPWTSGPAPGGKGTFSIYINQPLREEPNLEPGRPDPFGQKEQAVSSAAGMVEKAETCWSGPRKT